eukprot:359365-Chlamydomonas_euryale.AAC.18
MWQACSGQFDIGRNTPIEYHLFGWNPDPTSGYTAHLQPPDQTKPNRGSSIPPCPSAAEWCRAEPETKSNLHAEHSKCGRRLPRMARGPAAQLADMCWGHPCMSSSTCVEAKTPRIGPRALAGVGGSAASGDRMTRRRR